MHRVNRTLAIVGPVAVVFATAGLAQVPQGGRSGAPAGPSLMQAAPKLLDALAPEDAEHFAAVRELLDTAGVRYELDPTLVRGLDYYTRTLFEFTSDALGLLPAASCRQICWYLRRPARRR